MAKMTKSRGAVKRGKDRGPKLQPKPKPTRLKRGGDDLFAVAAKKSGKKETAARKKAGGKKKTVRKSAGKK